jgi:hypothetical protein
MRLKQRCYSISVRILCRIVLGLCVAAAPICAQQRVDPKNLYHRIICVTPLTGSGTAADPVRPKYAPWPLPAQEIRTQNTAPAMPNHTGIIAFTYLPSDDGKSAIVEFVARERSAFQAIFNDTSLQIFEKGKVPKATIEAALQKYRKNFNLDQFGMVMP